MGEIQEPRPVLLIVAAFSRYEAAFDWFRERAIGAWGPVALESSRFPFGYTRYYEAEMGANLSKAFFAFERLIEPGVLPALKILSNAWEEDYGREAGVAESRPLNLDPGYLTEAKLVLATTKDRDHRLYLADGIYAEGTLYFHRGEWRSRPWTYPDYQQESYHAFFSQCRSYLRERLQRAL